MLRWSSIKTICTRPPVSTEERSRKWEYWRPMEGVLWNAETKFRNLQLMKVKERSKNATPPSRIGLQPDEGIGAGHICQRQLFPLIRWARLSPTHPFLSTEGVPGVPAPSRKKVPGQYGAGRASQWVVEWMDLGRNGRIEWTNTWALPTN